MKDRTLTAAVVLAALCAAPFLPLLARGLTIFWGDLTYIHHPWRALDAEILMAGRAPLWNPYVYLGMPLAAVMQDSLFYPASAPFYLFGFASALSFFLILHLWLAGMFAFLWLRSLKASAAAALGGACVYALGGLLLENRQFPNHLAVLSLLPAALLFSRKPVLLALVLCCSFLAGFPPFFLGTLFLLAAMSGILAARFDERLVLGWAAAAALGLALAAALLFPAVELVLHSRRASGVGLVEALNFGLSPRDLGQWISPLFASGHVFDPEVQWWKCDFLGFSGALACAVGIFSSGRRGVFAALTAGAAIFLALGSSTHLSRLAWENFPLLRFVRYPGNVAYLAWPALIALAAAGLSAASKKSRGAAAAWTVLIAVELSAYGWGALRAAPRGLFTAKSPLIGRLQRELEGRRYLLSPRALETHAGAGVFDWEGRLYGLTNAPFRIRSAGNFGEPLVPSSSYRFMDALYAAPGAAAAAGYFAQADILYLLSSDSQRAPSLAPAGKTTWEFARLKTAPSRAYWLSPAEGAGLPEGAGVLPKDAAPLLSPPGGREDRFEIRASADARPGFAFVSEPDYPGWKIFLETDLGSGRIVGSPALGAFQKVPVPAGPWSLHFLYDPVSWRCGLALTWAAALALAAWALRRSAAWVG